MKQLKNKNSLWIFLLLGQLVFAQKAEEKEKIQNLEASNTLTWEANQALSNEEFVKAEGQYRKAISKSEDNAAAPFNLGNAHFNRASYNEAFGRFKEAGELASSKLDKQKAYHNMGNVFMKSKEYQKAVDSYKEALRNNPIDEETRYNLALAKEMLKKQQEEDKKNQDKKDKDKDQDKKDQDKKDENKEKDKDKEGDNKEDKGDKEDKNKEGDKEKEDSKEGDGDKKKKEEKSPENGDKPQDQKQQQQPRPNQLSPQQVKNLLEAMQNEEKKVKEKMDAKKVKGAKVRTEKDW